MGREGEGESRILYQINKQKKKNLKHNEEGGGSKILLFLRNVLSERPLRCVLNNIRKYVQTQWFWLNSCITISILTQIPFISFPFSTFFFLILNVLCFSINVIEKEGTKKSHETKRKTDDELVDGEETKNKQAKYFYVWMETLRGTKQQKKYKMLLKQKT